MFYLKCGKKKLLIEDDNTFVQCLKCGREMQIGLENAVVDGRLELYSLSWFCQKCGEEVRKEALSSKQTERT